MNDKDHLSSSIPNLKLGNDIPEEELSCCIREITQEAVSFQKKKDFLKALAQKGENYEEFSVFIREFRKMSIDPELQEFAPNAIDLCGTGGDKAHSFNISTFVSFIVAVLSSAISEELVPEGVSTCCLCRRGGESGPVPVLPPPVPREGRGGLMKE